MKKVFLFLVIAGFGFAAFGDTVSKLLEEFERRDGIKLTAEEGNAINFLKSIGYKTDTVIELDVLNPATTFVFRDKNGDICMGDMIKVILRCKNEMGLTGVTFQGDSD